VRDEEYSSVARDFSEKFEVNSQRGNKKEMVLKHKEKGRVKRGIEVIGETEENE